MCLIVLINKVHSSFPLIIAANRDEFLDRPTRQAAFWDDAPHILAGKDLRHGGTWMGITTTNRLAALTNYRDLTQLSVEGSSRGLLVRNALEADFDPKDPVRYDGHNLIYGQLDALRYHNNIDGTDRIIEPGIYGLSNHLLDTPWPKVIKAKEDARILLNIANQDLVEGLFSVLRSSERAKDNELPSTGVPLEWERSLSSIFIATKGYGTRCSTVILVDGNGRVTFEERTYAPLALPTVKVSFQI